MTVSITEPASSDPPTALSDPQAYLCLKKFNSRLARCPRTNLPVTFSDIGDECGVPLLYLLPSGCSRWIAASMDPLAKLYGVRMIVVDRPGCGGTGEVPLVERIESSCEMIVSVLEYLDIKPANILASSAGIYYALHLSTRHPSIFSTCLNPPPKLYLIAPWSPLLPPTHPDYWPFKWDWIPSSLIATQHITTPHLIKAAEGAQKAYVVSSRAFNTGKSFALKWYRSLTGPEPDEEPITPSFSTNFRTQTVSSPAYTTGPTPVAVDESASDLLRNMRGGNRSFLGEGTAVAHPQVDAGSDGRDQGDDDAPKRLWGPCDCCVSCLTNAYMGAENGQGIGQEHLICLNRGPEDTGSKWLETAVSDLAATIDFAQIGDQEETASLESATGAATAEKDKETKNRRVPVPIDVHVWWGWEDDMVPRKGQLWFNKIMGAYPDTVNLTIHDVEDGDHTDLLSRVEGLHQVLDMVGSQGKQSNSEAETGTGES
ncbi:hypothetical protein I316_06735 [Kwoniella heveanensis BCC8398]|uniref:AB hydrolase-1 domain-containing protein n=1 Tax=Kwoniella heveanensis BCC8398 TaxID=1296120 RepID=A0A1B9GKI8_9TREE|nr:hypothetical protein I316_06735 [Kwoniella heveanensis BCC8398]